MRNDMGNNMRQDKERILNRQITERYVKRDKEETQTGHKKLR